jgi:predicted Zn finger-like uncharacterized protein
MIEVQCTSCHTRYRIDEQVLPEGLPTFKCSRCGHVFSLDPRKPRLDAQNEGAVPTPPKPGSSLSESSAVGARPPQAQDPLPGNGGSTARDEPPSSASKSVSSDASGIPKMPGAGAAASDLQSEPAGDEDQAKGKDQSGLDSNQSPRDEPSPADAESSPQPSSYLRAKQAEKFYSHPFTGKNPDAVSGENLSFDFADEEPSPDEARLARRSRRRAHATPPSRPDSERWQVGDDLTSNGAASRNDGPFAEDDITRRSRRQMRIDDTEQQFSDDSGYVDEEEAPVYNRAMTHSARFFLLLIFLIGAGFGALTLLIHGAPSESSVVLSYLPVIGDRFLIPATPAKLVALRDVNAVYQHGKEGQNTLVISGSAENVGTASLRVVQLTAALRDAQRHSLASQVVYCGNSVSAGMIGQMTAHEIEFLQKLEPARTFALEPSASCRFVAVFMNPPGTARAYDVSVSQAVPGTAPSIEEPAS